MKKKRAVIAMSGGVDSSVVAAVLQNEGYECIGMHLQLWVDPETDKSSREFAGNKCCTLGGLEDARAVCSFLGIPFYVMNAVREFKENVVDYFLQTYAEGRTPNPCVECNRSIKFGELLNRARELNADFLASGHYVRNEKNERGEYELRMARDTGKDQSYFLYHLNQEKLSKVLFPLGSLLKSEVYDLARKFKLPRVAEKKESQGLCFFAEASPQPFLRRYLQKELFAPGPIITTDGRMVGTHKGLPLYTIGQRSGLGIGGIAGEPEGEAWYVIEINRERNRLVVGRKEDARWDSFEVSDVHFIAGAIPSEKFSAEVRIRHRGELVPAVIEMNGATALVQCSGPFSGVSCGQSAVFYQDSVPYQGQKLIGGGIIEKVTSYEKKAHDFKGTGVSLAH